MKKECYNMNRLKNMMRAIKQRFCKHDYEYSTTPLSFGILEGILYKKCSKCGHEDYDMEAVYLKLTNTERQ